MVLMRAMSRRTWRTRAVFSSWPLGLWKRRLNASLRELAELGLQLVVGLGAHVGGLHAVASLTPTRVTNRVSIGSLAAASSNASRAIVPGTPSSSNMMRPGFTRQTQNSGRALAAAHADFGRLLRHRHVGEDADPHAADALDVARDGATRGLDLARGDAARLDRLQAVRAEVEVEAALGLAVDAALVGLARRRAK